jgi:hypothetical protein
MIFDKDGQTFSSGGRVFSIGGTAWCPRERNGELFCTIRAIRSEDNESPTAQCDFGEDGTKCLPLDVLEPVSQSVPTEAGKLYVLYYIYDGSCNANNGALGVSSDKSVLIRKMLDDLDSDSSIKVRPVYATSYADGDMLCFSFEEVDSDGYLGYTIMPVPIYPGGANA